MDHLMYVIRLDPARDGPLSDTEALDRLKLWRDKARRHARMDEAAFYTTLIGIFQRTQAADGGNTTLRGRGSA